MPQPFKAALLYVFQVPQIHDSKVLSLTTPFTVTSRCYHCPVVYWDSRYLHSCRGLHTAQGPQPRQRVNCCARCTLIPSRGLRDTHVDRRGPSNKKC